MEPATDPKHRENNENMDISKKKSFQLQIIEKNKKVILQIKNLDFFTNQPSSLQISLVNNSKFKYLFCKVKLTYN